MISLIKSLFWIAILLLGAYFIMGLLGYKVNTRYFSHSQKQCEDRLKSCSSHLIHKGIDNAQCNFQCMNPKLIIKKK